MSSAFIQSLKSLTSTVVLGEESTPDVLRKRRSVGEKPADAKATPAKKARGGTADGAKATSSRRKKSELDVAEEAAEQEKGATPEAEEAAEPKKSRKAKQPEAGEAAEPKKGRKAKPEGDVAEGAAEPKKGWKAKREGPYTKFKEAGSIPEPSIARREFPSGAKSFKAVCWNLGGLRAFARNRPEALPELARREQPDVLGVLEHKLQDGAADTESTMKALLESLPDYETASLHCSTAKKGYSGTLVLLRRDGPKPLKVEAWDLPCAKDEGRLITVEFEALFLVLAYVPNSGDGLKRLDERIGQWDAQLKEKLQELASRKPTVLLGDLNVAHRDEDIWNAEALHIPKSAGTTREERESFSALLGAGFADGFARLHPEALGAFTYWSVRAGNRPQNRGLRLDYAVVSSSLLTTADAPRAGAPALVDVFHLADMSPGDHCPMGVLLSL